MKRLEVDRQKLKSAIWGERAIVASFLSIHPNSLSRKINGKLPFTIEELNEIASYLNQDTKEFLIEVTSSEGAIRGVSKSTQERFDYLAEKNTEGTLTDSEWAEYSFLVEKLEELMMENAERLTKKRISNV